MSGFLSSFISNQISELLCVCINDSDPTPDEHDTDQSTIGITTGDSPTNIIDNDIKSVKSDHSGSTETKSLTPSKDNSLASTDYYKEGLLAHESGDYTQAISFYQRALELNSKFTEAHRKIGEAYQLCKNATAAEKHYKAVIKLDPFSYKTIYKLGYMYLNDLKKPNQAVAMFEKCLDIDPSDADAKISLALAYMEIDKIPEAITAFQELLENSPEDVVVRFNLGNAYLDTAAYSEAVAQYMKVLEINKKHVDASFNMAIAYQHMARAEDISNETRLRYLSCAMRCYVQISSWKDSISRQFVVEALKGVESIRKEQSKYSTNGSGTMANGQSLYSSSISTTSSVGTTVESSTLDEKV